MNWKISHKINNETFAPLQTGYLTNIRVKNLTNKQMVITKYYLTFDWMGTYGYINDSIYKIPPNKSKELPDIHFSIELSAPKGSHKYKIGMEYQLLENDEWKKYIEKETAGDFIEIKSLPQKDYTVFVSHSNSESDKIIVKECSDAMKSCGITGYFSEEDIQPGGIVWNKITNNIKNSDAFLLLWTQDAANSGDVREEIGLAIGNDKKEKIVAIVQKGIDVKGSIKSLGKEWIDYMSPDHTHSLQAALQTIMEWAREKEVEKSKIQNLVPKRSRQSSKKLK